ncbi:hypothetical protein [Candidatus Binatus sp.]|jgi:hypothetical protein|uniref:hypothetical protein n=1 Tax=Candidatus Binatus sp. TaxID=2811406 RepID=UPI003BCB58FD
MALASSQQHDSRNRRTPTVCESAAQQGLPEAVERVREVLVQLAPELIQDLAQLWRGTLSAIEGTQIIEDQENSAVRWRP